MSTSSPRIKDENNEAPTELTAAVEDLLTQLTTKFATLTNDISAKMDEMSKRLDTLEGTIRESARLAAADESKSS